MSHPIQPYYVAPLLIEQPTWGGEYIAEFKGLTHPALAGKKIGQSFELAAASRLLATLPTEATFGLAPGSNVHHPTWYGQTADLITLTDVAADQTAAVYGTKANGDFSTLIKFTQAQNNSYQVHVKPGQTVGHWQAKPESWYYLEKGKATLGLTPNCDLAAYQARATTIDLEAHRLSDLVKGGTLSVSDARTQLQTFIAQDHPTHFVNTVWIEPGQVVDLSQGGIHHSWEKDPSLTLGNIVYEVQVDVADENCTLRSFDQGNIKDDGSVRPLGIAEYFEALDTDLQHNHVDQYLSKPAATATPSGSRTELFVTLHYRSEVLELTTSYQPEYQRGGETFAHVFVMDGEVTIASATNEWRVTKGVSLFIPASFLAYQIIPVTNAKVIITTL